jgi:hypothetical protein
MPDRRPHPRGLQPADARAIDRRSFLAAAPAAGLAVGAVAMIGADETPPPGSDPDRHLEYRETPHIRAYYRRARY